jgi:hypothetical protein
MIDEAQVRNSFAVSGLSQNEGQAMFAGLNKTVILSLVAAGAVWWMFFKPKKRSMGM